MRPSCAARKRNWARPRPSPPRRTSWPGSSTPCCAMARSTWMLAPNTTTSVPGPGVARGQAPAGPVGLPVGASFRCSRTHHVRTSWPANRRVTIPVSREQRYARIRPVQRRLTGESSQDMYAHGEVCRLDEDRAGIGAYCPIGSMVRESYDGIIGDAPPGAIPFHRLFDVGDSLRRHAYAAIAGG